VYKRQTPGFGVFGITGGLLLLVVFFGHYVAGFSGHEPVLLFALGLLLIGLEIFLLPGTVFLAATGGLLLLVSLVWSMADLWPNEPVTFSGEVFLGPLWSVASGMMMAAVLMVILVRFLPRNWVWDRLVLQAAVVGTTQLSAEAANVPGRAHSLLGRRGTAVTDLFPSGQVEIDGRLYDAHLALGTAKRGTTVVVTNRTDFGLEVEAATS
jgi:membrane-bound serine protease (ClpP class)